MQLEESNLELLLRLAYAEPARRQEFYQALMGATVHVIGNTENPDSDQGKYAAGDKISVVTWKTSDGSPIIPFFSSIEALRLCIDQEVRYMSFPARGLFEMTKGTKLVLNPRSEFSKEFAVAEIEALLAQGASE